MAAAASEAMDQSKRTARMVSRRTILGAAAAVVGFSTKLSPTAALPLTAIVIPSKLKFGPPPSAVVWPLIVLTTSNPVDVSVRTNSPGANALVSVIVALSVASPVFD